MESKKIIAHISNWLNEYCESSFTKGFVVGVSGGIDSALTSTLAAETGKEVLVIEMPIHQHISQVTRAQDHIEFLKNKYPNVKSLRVDLTESYETFRKSIPETNLETEEMALVNTRARVRMTTLFYFAGLHGLLVAGTGNKVEDFGIGFFTKYGDGGVDISPIADLMKSEVYALSKDLGVIDSILIAAPTDGLWGDDKTDEDQIGASYNELEWAMRLIENNESEEELTERQKIVLEIYKKRNRANQHKMNPIPVCVIPAEYK
ncbi:MAG: NAD(+) synthase [Ichthyobacteriaceae bacterium]|nr:NAD(+) synthase [Ichthyobacteriaceae bacterium]